MLGHRAPPPCPEAVRRPDRAAMDGRLPDALGGRPIVCGARFNPRVGWLRIAPGSIHEAAAGHPHTRLRIEPGPDITSPQPRGCAGQSGTTLLLRVRAVANKSPRLF